MKAAFIFSLLALLSLPALAHKPSDSYLSISSESEQTTLQWDIALRDLETAIGLDADNDGQITWQELLNQKSVLTAYVSNRLAISNAGQACRLQPLDLKVDEHSDGHYAVIYFLIDCASAYSQLNLNYQLFFDFDRQHRGLLKINSRFGSMTHIFSPEQPGFQFSLNSETTAWQELLNFGVEGLHHIWQGYDHILFLLSLILPAALRREQKTWRVQLNLSTAFWDVLRIVSAFTLAHSLTLSLTALHFIALPSRWVESAIAASVLCAALNNIYPVYINQRTWFAFGFGLIHGMGIAGVLLDMGLPDKYRVLSLLGFNLGVEAGQLAIVCLVLPLITIFSRYRFYPQWVLKFGSLGIAGIAGIWLLERSLDFQINWIT